MTLAWYGHLKLQQMGITSNWPLIGIITLSWSIAFFEYCFQVPANRLGYGRFNATQLKIIQEVISISVFLVFAILVLGEKMKWNYAVSFGLILGAVYFAFGFGEFRRDNRTAVATPPPVTASEKPQVNATAPRDSKI